MTKQSEQTDVTVPDEHKTKAGLSRRLGSWWHYVLVLFFAALLSVGIWSRPDQVMLGDDYAFHVARLQSAARAWGNGQILPQVDPEALGGFGYAYNVFYGPLLTYVAAGLNFVIGSWPIVINLVLVLCLMAAGFTMYYAMARIGKNRMLALMIAVIYMASPYLLNNIYGRMALGEVAAAVAAPILLLGLYQLTAHEKHATRSLALTATLLILSHSLSAMLFALMAAVYVVINIDRVLNIRCVWRMVLAVGVTIGLTAFFTFPLVEAWLEGDYGVFDTAYSEAYFGANPESMNDHRVWPQQLVTLEYAGGEYGIALGVMALVGILGFWFVRRKIEDVNERRFVTSLYVIAVVGILAMLPVVDWRYAPSILWEMQCPWRLMMIVMTALAVVAGYTIFAIVRRASVEKQAVVAIAAAVAAVYAATPMIRLDETRHLADFAEVEEDLATVGFQAEYAPIGLLCDPENEADLTSGYACSIGRIRENLGERGTKLKVVEGEARLSKAVKDGLRVEFEVRNSGEKEAVIELPLIWYPGYRARMGEMELVVEQSERYGLVTVAVPSGMQGKVEVGYEMTRPTEIGISVSVVTAGLGVVWIMISGVYDWHKRRKQKEVDSLIDSVWEAMAENEELQVPEEKPVKKTSRAAVPSKSDSTSKSRAKKTGKAATEKRDNPVKEAETEKAVKEASVKKTPARKTTVTRRKSVTMETEPSQDEDESKPRVTKVKARTKKEV